MTQPRYRYAHQQQRKRLKPYVNRGEAFCVEPVCLKPDRWIHPGDHEYDCRNTRCNGCNWDVCHDPTGTIVTGTGHTECNRSEGASRGNRMRSRQNAPNARRWVL